MVGREEAESGRAAARERAASKKDSQRRIQTVPVALTIAGSDSSAGAGIQADLKTFSALGVYGLTAVTCIVAEIPGKVSRIEPASARIVREQIEVPREEFSDCRNQDWPALLGGNRFRCRKDTKTHSENGCGADSARYRSDHRRDKR